MSGTWNNVRELWTESVWFRVSLATLVISSILLARSTARESGARYSATAAPGAATDVREALDNSGLSLTAQQEQLVLDSIDSLTHQQRKHYDLFLDRLRQIQTSHQP